MPEIEILISPTGESTITVKGASGPGCKDLTKALEGDLGTTINDELTQDYYKHQQSQIRQNQR